MRDGDTHTFSDVMGNEYHSQRYQHVDFGFRRREIRYKFGKNFYGHAYNSQVQEIIDLNKCKKERLFMEERDDLEQMAFIQKWNDGKAEREKKREQMWNGILEKAGIKKEEK